MTSIKGACDRRGLYHLLENKVARLTSLVLRSGTVELQGVVWLLIWEVFNWRSPVLGKTSHPPNPKFGSFEVKWYAGTCLILMPNRTLWFQICLHRDVN